MSTNRFFYLTITLSVCCFVLSSCTTTTDYFLKEACNQTFAKGEMVVGIESTNSCIVKYSDIVSFNPQVINDFLCDCRLEKVSKIKFFGMYCIKLFDDNNGEHLLILSKNKEIIRFDGHYYKLKDEDSKKLDLIINNIISQENTYN